MWSLPKAASQELVYHIVFTQAHVRRPTSRVDGPKDLALAK
jgi:hypothetical protein